MAVCPDVYYSRPAHEAGVQTPPDVCTQASRKIIRNFHAEIQIFVYNRPPAENRCTRNRYSNKKLIGGLTSHAYFQRAEIQVNVAHRLGFS